MTINMKILAFGTFDKFHPGHQNFLEQAKSLGDQLTVVIARDQTVEQVKGRKPKDNEKVRLSTVKKNPVVDRALLGYLKADKISIIDKVKPDIIALGYDQNSFSTQLATYLNHHPEIKLIRLKAYKPEIYKSSKIING